MYIGTIDSPESLKKETVFFLFLYSPRPTLSAVISAPRVFRLAVNRVITLVGRPFKIQHRSGSRLLLSIHGFDMIHRDRAAAAAAASSPARRRISRYKLARTSIILFERSHLYGLYVLYIYIYIRVIYINRFLMYHFDEPSLTRIRRTCNCNLQKYNF